MLPCAAVAIAGLRNLKQDPRYAAVLFSLAIMRVSSSSAPLAAGILGTQFTQAVGPALTRECRRETAVPSNHDLARPQKSVTGTHALPALVCIGLVLMAGALDCSCGRGTSATWRRRRHSSRSGRSSRASLSYDCRDAWRKLLWWSPHRVAVLFVSFRFALRSCRRARSVGSLRCAASAPVHSTTPHILATHA